MAINRFSTLRIKFYFFLQQNQQKVYLSRPVIRKIKIVEKYFQQSD